MRKISADLIITHDGMPLSDGVVIYDEETTEILDVLEISEGIGDVKHHRGVLIPGYVNAHCHLELSHLKDVIPTGTGLIPFIQGVVSLRDFPQEVIDEQIIRADQEMFNNGIVAVGDISNKADTAITKEKSPIRYYTFVEMFDFLQEDQALTTFEGYREVFENQSDHGQNKKSYVPHAPYSVSKRLFDLINEHNQGDATVSIHNQELHAENQLFLDKTGEFLDFYKGFGLSLDQFEPIAKSAIHYTLEHLSTSFRTIMVHNTTTTKHDIAKAQIKNPQIYWATCPNANLYIENALPNYKDFIDCGAKMCIGTDSLSSNWQLSIFEEMRTIKRFQSDIDDIDLIKWATLHGAQALGYQDLGRIVKGSRPAINLIDVPVVEGKFNLNEAVSSLRIV